MSRLTFATVGILVCALGCGSPPPPKSPEKSVDVPDQEETSSEKGSSTSTDSPSSDTKSPAPPPAAPVETKPGCEGLVKTKCKVTQGCAWYELSGKGKCVEDSAQN